MKPLSILVADDERNICLLLEEWLKPLGHVVVMACNGTEALKLAEKALFDLVITDVLMPESDGPKLIEHVKKIQPAARFLAISGGGRYIDSNECLAIARGFGADAAIMKPFNREELLEAIDSATKRREVPVA